MFENKGAIRLFSQITTIAILFVALNSASAMQIEPALLSAIQKAIPSKATTQLIEVLRTGLWNSTRTALAVSIPQQHQKDSVIFVFLRQPDGTYQTADVSKVEAGNFGKLGLLPRTAYERFETTPVEWLSRDDGLFQVRICTTAWRSGQRYTVYEPLIIKPDGIVLWR